MSFVIAVALSVVGAILHVHNSVLSNRDDWFIPFMFGFLFLYMYNLFFSIVNFALGQKIRDLGTRLMIFNILGLVVVLTVWFLIREIIFLISFSTFIMLSLVAVIVNQGKSKA